MLTAAGVGSVASRVITATLLGGFVIASVLGLPTPFMGAVLGAFLVAGVWEWTFLAGVRTHGTRLGVLAGCVAASLALTLLAPPRLFAVAMAAAALVWLAASFAVIAYERGNFSPRVSRLRECLLGCFALAACWSALVDLHAAGPGQLLMLFAIIWGSDIAAYAVGRPLGRHKLAPRTSPGKSWEGLVGAFVGGLVAALLASRLLGLAVAAAPLAALTIVTVAFATFGDLAESMLKRRIGRKDSGALLPGHGGVLDRIDALIAGSVVFWLLSSVWLVPQTSWGAG